MSKSTEKTRVRVTEKKNYPILRRISARMQGASSGEYRAYSPLGATQQPGRKTSKMRQIFFSGALTLTILFLIMLSHCGFSQRMDEDVYRVTSLPVTTSTVGSSQQSLSDAKDSSLIKALLSPWQLYEQSWVDNATIIFTGTYGTSSYPCIFEEDGSIIMLTRFYFDIEKIIKGEINKTQVDFNTNVLGRKDTPSFLVEGREYLVIAAPVYQNLEILKNPEASFTLYHHLSGEEIISIIDLSQTQDEHDSFAVKATRSGSFDGFEFTPEKWVSLRRSQTSDVIEQNDFLPFIREKVLTSNASLKHVRSYLGDSDDQFIDENGDLYLTYDLNVQVMENERIGETYCSLDLHFSEHLELLEYSISYLEYFEDEDTRGTRYLSEEELNERGLNGVADFRP